MTRLQGKAALITGAASGIGRATARLFAAEGAAVALSDLADDQGKPVAAAITAAGGRALYLHHDVASEADWERVMAATLAQFGGVDVLVNNAGVGGTGTAVPDTSLEAWRRVMAVNLEGVFLGTKHAIRAMKAGGGNGSIVNVSSILGKVGLPMTGAYAATKAGVKLLSKSAALECLKAGTAIRVNSVHPGFTDTAMVQARLQSPDGERMARVIGRAQPGGELGRPEDIAEGILYLASDAARFVNGAELVIDGGATAQ
ncbi:MAG: glucose 1-dehydrogenase [Alphaproteobacteria bacterium]|nr:glucose 1-dehydrogenase [Alphaproteobacteria bacterium]